jgi:hypothetical protein
MNTFMKSTIRIDRPRQIIGLLFLFSGLSVSGVRATDRMPSASTQAIVSEARLNLAEARKNRSDPRTAVGHYLEAADGAVRVLDSSSPNERNEAQSIYDSAYEEVTILLRSPGEGWIIPQTIPPGKSTYQLPFAELKRLSRVNERARAAARDPDFSRRIRDGLPGM